MTKKKALTQEQKNNLSSLIKETNKRMTELEKLSKQKGFESVKQYAYRNLKEDIRALQGNRAKRIKVNDIDSMSARDYMKVSNTLQKFINAPSSTKKGILEIYQKRTSEFNTLTESDLTWQELAKLFESGLYEYLESDFGTSPVVVRMLATIAKNKEELKAQLEAGNKLLFSGEYAELLNAKFGSIANSDIPKILVQYLTGV